MNPDYDFLPRDEPGRPLYQLPPEFVDELMEKIRAMERRRRKARRNAVIIAVAAGVCVIALLAWAWIHF